MQKTLLILGATGAVGQQLLQQALAHADVARVIAPTRRALTAHIKLQNPIVDFNALPNDAAWWQVDAALCALGTTRKIAGSAAAFRRVDYDYVLQAAQCLHQAATPTLVLNSSLGANAQASGLYLRTKGEAERDVRALGFGSLTIVRPSLLDAGERPDRRRAEEFGLWFNRHFAACIPVAWRAVKVERVAATMLAAALSAAPGVSVIESAQMAEHD
ncbi:NAD(P)H-binding protein [Deefgea sp. CFH1-16]|uniref:NAD(P)H-binding protein n=1 Tax=Deefgea sp. CFH1-16 TaxID=2675457 RepID=UPI0015F61B6E|nr:NAD(P)H-binding protein [Deefgea sp. CFH1-16]MBM5575250.1 NAD(P)H-binding protein [Deefgea sp. CFH1-16]